MVSFTLDNIVDNKIYAHIKDLIHCRTWWQDNNLPPTFAGYSSKSYPSEYFILIKERRIRRYRVYTDGNKLWFTIDQNIIEILIE